MGRLYADSKSKKQTTVIAGSWVDDVVARHGMEVDWLVNERCDTLVIEGHVDLGLLPRQCSVRATATSFRPLVTHGCVT